MKSLTNKQIMVISAIWKLQNALGRFPTSLEVAGEVGLNSRISAYDHIVALIRKGYIERSRTRGKRYNVFRLSMKAESLLSRSTGTSMPSPMGDDMIYRGNSSSTSYANNATGASFSNSSNEFLTVLNAVAGNPGLIKSGLLVFLLVFSISVVAISGAIGGVYYVVGLWGIGIILKR